MACNCKKTNATKFMWVPEDSLDGEGSIVYPTEVQARAKVLRNGGSYKPYDPNTGLQIVR